MGTREDSPADSWGFAEGDAITEDLTAIKLLGGGTTYEAYLAFDDVTYAPTVVKIVRPHRVDDESSLRGLAREVDALSMVNHHVVARGILVPVRGGHLAPRRGGLVRAGRRAGRR